MTITTDITAADLIKYIKEMFNKGLVRAENEDEILKVQHYLEDEFIELEPITIALKSEALKEMLMVVILQGIANTIKG